MVNKNNEYIRKARKNRKIKKIILLCIFFILCGIIVITYTDIFKIKKVEISDESLLTEEYIREKSENLKGLNLVFLTNDKLKAVFNDNFYINDIKIKKSYPDKIKISVKEKSALYYQKDGSRYNILSDGMVYLENTDKIQSDKMIEIKGVDFVGKGIGETLGSSEREKEFLKNIYEVQDFLNKNYDNVKITSIDITDLSNIKCNFGNIEVYLGSDEDSINKVKTAALIYNQGVVKSYIKVNFNGSPDFK